LTAAAPVARVAFLLIIRVANVSGRDRMSAQPTVDGLTTLPAPRGVTATLDRLEALAKERGLMIFARINFSADARRVGLNLRATELLLLGSPKAGTPLMAAAPSLAIDLPLKVLAWQAADERVWVSYNAAEYLQRRHGFPPELLKNIAGLGALVEAAAGLDS
jgi:uncharacterized protein (DUF302 family)